MSLEKTSILNQTKSNPPISGFFLSKLKNEILGKKYELSVLFANSKTSQNLNKKFRQKDYPTNVLSFSLETNSGELVLCPAVIKKEAKNFEKTYAEFLGFLVIHGMLHLKGYDHGSIMDDEEQKIYAKYFGRNRHRLSHNKNNSGRNTKRRKKS